MIETLNEIVLWWHWIVFGILLLILEMFTGTFLMLGLAIAGILVGISDELFKTSLNFELSLWMALSILVFILWFKWFKNPTISQSGQSNYDFNTLGTILEEVGPQQRGRVIFNTPVLGNSSWYAISKSNISIGSRVRIIEVHGQLIEVEKVI